MAQTVSVNVSYWQAWFTWAQATLIAFAKKGDLLGMTAFLGDLGATVEALVLPFESLAACFNGNWLTIAGRLIGWVRSNPDPLKAFRDAATAMKAKWSAAGK